MKNINLVKLNQETEMNKASTTQTEILNEATPTSEKHLMRKGQGGFTLYDFIFWLGIASLALLALISLYNTATGMYKTNAVTTDVTQIKAAVSDWKGARTNVSGVSINELCKDGNGNNGASWCGENKDGRNANPYGGDYSVTVAANVSNIDVTITQVDTDNVNRQATKLAPMSVERCASMPCSSVTAAGETIKVTM
ncbi:hypothetical protein TUM4438_10570 [Shewanella sairae]|uniref:Type 4 secretion system PilS N-terminal domain-containing protein n=1 Tax=Shewanella sairae TaxID=190310 RepID=A0ABQ4P601_9GAMM|nr:hypothetical protein [Shewanella sairae]MCL1130490.1 hypothetical protein [Shewanella sairae]GIU42905.1 hypothetical protein TUM4438_10570 [Shewanella sairae]